MNIVYYLFAFWYCGEGTFQWYATTPCFLFGCIFAYFNDKVENQICKWPMLKRIFVVAVFLIICISSIIIGVNRWIPIALVWKYIIAPTAYIFAFIVLSYTLSLQCTFTRFLAKYSLEIYTLQGLCVIISGWFSFNHPLIQIAFVSALLIPIILVFHPCYIAIMKLPSKIAKALKQ